MAASRPVLHRAPWLVVDPDQVLRDGHLLVGGDRVLAVAQGAAAGRRLARRAARVEDHDGLLTPGLVNAHSHLELYALRGRVPARGGFAAWIGRLMEVRGCTPAARLRAGVAEGAERMRATGTTCVGDIDSLGRSAPVLRAGPLRVRLFREVLDAGDPTRTAAAWRALPPALPATRRYREGLAPHAPFTVSPGLLDRVARRGGRRRVPLTVHWAETEAEGTWLREGRGPLATLLRHSPGRSGLDLLEAAGLLGPGTSLVHGNHPARGEPARIAAAGAVVVHCPGSHRFFGREPFPLARYRRAGVVLGLGTDSAASNADVDLWRELRLLREAHPELSARAAWRMATEGSARALGLGDEVGRLRAGAFADWLHLEGAPRGVRGVLEHLTLEGPRVRDVWVGGVPARPPGDAR